MVMLSARAQWESWQRQFTQMRGPGLPRLRPPFPGCSQAHYPLIDLTIRRLKPFFLGQLTSGDKLCNFTSLKPDLAAQSDAAACYFDYIINNKTNFRRKMRVAVDGVCLRGRGVLKATVDPTDDYKIVIEAIDQMFILLPQESDNFEDAPEFIHIRMMPVSTYEQLDQRWDTSKETVQKIRGQDIANLSIYIQQKKMIEGITYTTNTSQVLFYEHWVKTKNGHTIYTYSPHSPDIQLRKPYGNPYKFQGKESVPFFSFQMEVCAEGWYAPRGIAELLSPVEQYMTKLWNEKADAMTFANRPLYTADKEVLNIASFRWQPGEFIPGNVRGVQQGTPPFNFDQEIGFAASIAEQQSQSPDFGISEPGNPSSKDPRTATEIKNISALQQTGVSDVGMLFREDLAKLYRHLWGMMVQFRGKELSYYAAGEVKTLPEQALHDMYLIEPDGSADGWNRMARFQKAAGLLQITMGNPNVNPEPITKELLAAYGDGMVLKAFMPTNLKGQQEYEAQAELINSLLVPGSGKPPFPVKVKPQDDHLARIKCNLDWMTAATHLGTPIDELGKQRIQQNTAEHVQMLQQMNPDAARQVTMEIQQLEAPGANGNGVPQ